MILTPAEINALNMILEVIARYGTPIVLLLLFIFWARPWADKIMARIVNVEKNTPVQEREDIEALILLNSKVNIALKEMKADLECDWAQLWQFHNGTHSIGGFKIPFMYLSLTHEVCNPGLLEMRRDFEQLPMSMFDTFAVEIISSDVVIHPKREVDRKPGDTVSRMGEVMRERFKASMAVMRAVRDQEGLVVGFICVAWEHKVEPNNQRITLVRQYAHRMAAVLASYHTEAILVRRK